MSGYPLRPGDVLDGFCGGAFGRDSFGRKVVESIGRDWVVVRDEFGFPLMACGAPDELLQDRVRS